ncbi:MAG TPA: 3-isopropylmalate dehydratase large subunit [Anaerovoracaceae bacterium]|nr:3-isopropylmalate dehydratase large subunit [Anaerovoracaceae bacterium]
MAMTISEKILASASGKDHVSAGDILTVNVDRLMSNDGTTHLTIDMFNKIVRNPKIADKDKLVFIIDHNIPSDSPETAAAHKKMRDFARENKISFYEGKGICHQIMMEEYVRPGELILGADSHTCIYGALGAFGTGVGNTDFLYAMVTGRSWVLVPETLRFHLTGRFREGVYPRDLILKIIGDIGADGATYKAMEFTGDAAKEMNIDQRMVLTNMAVEAGAKTGIFEPDENAIEYLKKRNREPKHLFKSDPGAIYEKEYFYNLEDIRPVVSIPHNVDDVVEVESVKGVKIDQAFIGSCNNGRMEELRVAANILKGRRVDRNVRLLISPASNTVYLEALNEGLIDIFIRAGAMVMNSNCSVCWGSCQGVIGEGEVLISTGTRNFKGRAGHKDSKVYLASAATVAASAISGEITTAI